MAINYTYEYRAAEASYPNTVPDIIEYKDVKDANSTVVNLISTIENYMRSGDVASANRLIKSNLSTLKPYLISAADVNRIIEDIRNTQIYGLARSQEVYFVESAPAFAETGDVWVGGGGIND